MPGYVRIEIEDHKTLLASMQYKIGFILIGIARNQTKDATASLRINAGCDVPGPPGTPQSLQFRHLDLFAIKGWADDGCRRLAAVKDLSPMRVSRNSRR